MATTLIDTNSIEYIMREHLIRQVREYLINSIDKDLEMIARDAVGRYLEYEIHQNNNPMSLKNEIYFSFVNKITNIVTEEVVIKEVDKGKTK